MTRSRGRWWLGYLVLGLAAAGAVVSLPSGGRAQAFLSAGVHLAMLGALVTGMLLHRPDRPRPWQILLAATVVSVVAHAIRYPDQVGPLPALRFPSVADALYLASRAMVVAALLLMARTRGGIRGDLVDALIVAAGLGVLWYVFLIDPYVDSTALSIAAKVVAAAYPLMDLLLLAVAARLAFVRGPRPPALWFLILYVVARLVADTVYGLTTLGGTFSFGRPLYAGWLASFAFLGAAALHPSMRALTEPAPPPETESARRRLWLLGAATLVGPAMLVFRSVWGGHLHALVIGTISGALFVLVLVRINGLMVDTVEHRRIERELSEAETRYRTLVQQLPAFTYIDVPDPTSRSGYRSVYASPQIEAMIRYTPEEFCADPEIWTRMLRPEDRERQFAEDAQLWATGESYTSEYRLVTRDGRMRWVRNDAVLVQGASGEPRFNQGVMYDITETKTAEEVVRRSEGRFRSLLRNAPDAVLVVDADGIIALTNLQADRLFGYAADELAGRPLEDLVPERFPDTHAAHRAAYVGAPDVRPMGTGLELFGRCKDGTEFPAEVSLSSVPGEEAGSAPLVVAFVRDITERKRAEEELRRAEARYRGIFENAAEGIFQTTLDGRYLGANAALARMLGYDSPEDLMASITDVRALYVDPAQREAFARRLAVEDVWGFEYQVRRKDGGTIWVSENVRAARDAEGHLVGFEGMSTDITEQKQAEEQVRATEAKYRMLVENIPAIVYLETLDDDPIAFYMSPQVESLLGYSPEEFRDPTFWGQHIHPEDREDALAAEARSNTTGEPYACEYRLIGKDGRTVWVRDEAALVQDEEGRPFCWQGVIVDISERKRAEEEVRRLNAELEQRVIERTEELVQAKEEAERANRAKSEFLSRASHELRTPLNAVLGFGQLLGTSPLSREDREGVEEILRAGRHLLDLVNEVLDISRIDSGRLSLSIEPVSVDEVVHETLDLILPLSLERSVRLRTEISQPSLYVMADRQRLTQVLLNLLSNAVKYNREGGGVTVSCERSRETVTLGVTDTGPGIASEHMDRLFSPFDRLGAETSDQRGIGLGLALTKALAEAMGGTVSARSKVGEGSTFTVELVGADEPQGSEAPGTLGSEPSGALVPARTVLYVEDNAANLRLLERILAHRPGVRLVAAMQGRLGVELARDHRPDLVLLDLHLPDITGEEVLACLRADPDTAHIPVVVMSADDAEGYRRKLLTAGARDYLTKPINVNRFLEVVDAILGMPAATGEG